MLMERFDIQINKTSRNTVLFMLNIGSTRGAVAYLLDVLLQDRQETGRERPSTRRALDAAQLDRTASNRSSNELPPLPNFSRFHPQFHRPGAGTPEGDMRAAFFLAYDEDNCEYLVIDGALAGRMQCRPRSRRQRVVRHALSARLPGPGARPGRQRRASSTTCEAVDVKEIHGYDPRASGSRLPEGGARGRQAEPSARFRSTACASNDHSHERH